MSELSARVHELLLERAETVATAESLTAGLLGAALTETPGSSATYRGGVIVYATDLKSQLAGVGWELLEERGAVDPDVAVAMATGVRERLAASWAIGITGVAGPDPQDGVAVGTAYLGLAGPVGAATVHALSLGGDREAIRAGAVEIAMRVLYDRLAEPE